MIVDMGEICRWGSEDEDADADESMRGLRWEVYGVRSMMNGNALDEDGFGSLNAFELCGFDLCRYRYRNGLFILQKIVWCRIGGMEDGEHRECSDVEAYLGFKA